MPPSISRDFKPFGKAASSEQGYGTVLRNVWESAQTCAQRAVSLSVCSRSGCHRSEAKRAPHEQLLDAGGPSDAVFGEY